MDDYEEIIFDKNFSRFVKHMRSGNPCPQLKHIEKFFSGKIVYTNSHEGKNKSYRIHYYLSDSSDVCIIYLKKNGKVTQPTKAAMIVKNRYLDCDVFDTIKKENSIDKMMNGLGNSLFWYDCMADNSEIVCPDPYLPRRTSNLCHFRKIK